MPKAAVNKYGQAIFPKDEIGMTEKVLFPPPSSYPVQAQQRH
jgi:hypothetical protein